MVALSNVNNITYESKTMPTASVHIKKINNMYFFYLQLILPKVYSLSDFLINLVL